MTEVFYPHADQAQIGDMQFLITDGKGYFSEQKRDVVYDTTYLDDGMTVHIYGQEPSGRYSFDQEIVTDPALPVVRIHTVFTHLDPGLRVFILFHPAINNSGMGNLGTGSPNGLFATKAGAQIADGGLHDYGNVTTGLVSATPFMQVSAGFVGTSDGWQDLSRNFQITFPFNQAGPGNIALTAELPTGDGGGVYDFALAFGRSQAETAGVARTSLVTPFAAVRAGYEAGWHSYLRQITQKGVSDNLIARRSAVLIKMHEDKAIRGAIVASLSTPALPDDNAVDGIGGYHLIWPRDLYHAAMGLLAAGDLRTPVDVLRYYVRTQRGDGSWAQNFWVDGTPYWGGLQMDEVSFPVLLAGQLQRRGVYSLGGNELNMIRRAANYIITHGPATLEDRWEEIGGFVPSTIAAEIAALKVAAQLTQDVQFGQTAQQWQDSVDNWTAVRSGSWGGSYYIRTSPSGNPNQNEVIQLANGAGRAYASDILDGGFLELVRQGVRSFNDPLILSTLRLYESSEVGIATSDVPGAMTYHRYNRDGYGPGGTGGFWPLLAGERGMYALAAHDYNRAQAQLAALEKSANHALLIPEQTIGNSETGVGFGVACPLVWAHAEDILLHRSIQDGRVFDSPDSQ